MAADTCHYDCSNAPTTLSPYPDISGIGVSLSYTLTAGLALFIVFINYVFVYRPDVLPHGIDKRATTESQDGYPKPNLIDVYFLDWRSSRSLQGSQCDCDVPTRNDRIKNALTYCMLLLSDFQLVTGLAILVSGFTQLRCGISVYHWHKIVQLAWLSSITHLCCLTFLRDYFYQHKMAQLWRIPGMIILVVMLTFALIPTAQYTWYFDDKMTREDVILFVSKPAICSFFPYQHSTTFQNRAGIQRAGISITLMTIGMFVRLCQLYQTPTDAWCNLDSPLPVLSTVFLYRPLLTVFLCYRTLFDVASSKAFEVWWLAVSFAWGASNLWHQKYDIEPESREWTFGQVIALVLLFAPIVGLIEGYLIHVLPSTTSPGQHNSHLQTYLLDSQPRTPSYIELRLLPTQTPHFLEHGPDYDFYNNSSFSILVTATIFTIAQICTWTLLLLASGDFTPLDALVIYTPYSLAMSFSTCVLLSLIFGKLEPCSPSRRRFVLVLYFFLYFVMLQIGVLTGFMGMFLGYDMWLRIGGV
ncbi:Nn.00g044390.m01.CDS01 [Neocucurbitaria sp. VM-36]